MLIILSILMVMFLIWFIATYNNFVRGRNSVDEAFSTMDVYLKQRWDMIPNLLEIVKGYAKYEQETLESIVNLRSKSYAGMSQAEKAEADKEISKGVATIFALAEAYPDLKANENFMQLSGALTGVEEKIANARKYYNGCVKAYNNSIEVLPGSIIAQACRFVREPLFEAESYERENVDISFDK